MLLWLSILFMLLEPEPMPASKLLMLLMLLRLPPLIRAARLERLGLLNMLLAPVKGLPILGMEPGTSLMISNPWSSLFFVFNNEAPDL